MPTLTFKVSAEEARAIRAAARARKRTLSAHLRAELLGKKSPRLKVRMERHPVSGLYYNAAGKNLPPVTPEQVREILADFP